MILKEFINNIKDVFTSSTQPLGLRKSATFFYFRIADVSTNSKCCRKPAMSVDSSS